MKNKKLRAFLSGVLAVCFMLGAIVPASASGFLGGDLVKWVEDNWGNMISDLINGKSDDANDTAANDLTTTAATDSNFSKILHLDCGREYFSPEWIKALIVEMEKAGYNQLQLAFGNGGFRFYLDKMDVTVGGKTYYSDQVKAALDEAFVKYNAGKLEYTDNWKKTYTPDKNYLTQTEMNDIIKYAGDHHIEIVPLFNTPGHMQVLIGAMAELGFGKQTTDSLCVKDLGCLNLNKTDAVTFTQEILKKYIAYFKGKTKYFSLGADEYTEWNTDFYKYINACIKLVKDAEMTPRVFVDSFRKSQSAGITDTDVQVCYWYYDTNSVWTVNELVKANYGVINTSHDYYYVSTNEPWNLNEHNGNQGEGYTFVYNTETKNYAQVKDTWIKHALAFDKNTFSCKNSTQTSTSWNGAMFCIWTNVPYVRDQKQIAQDIRSILRIIGQRMNDVSTDKIDYSYNLDGGFNEDGTLRPVADTVYDMSDTIKVTAVGLTKLTANQLTDTADVKEKLDAVYPTDGTTTVKNFVAYDIIPATDEGNYTGTATVSIRIPTDWNASRVKAFVVTDGKAGIISGKADNGFYTFTAPHFSVMGLVELETQAAAPETIILEVDGTAKRTIPGNNSITPGYDEAVADVTVTPVGGESAGYEAVTSKNINTSTDFEGYYIYNNNSFLSINQRGRLSYTSGTEPTEDTTRWKFRSQNGGYVIYTEFNGKTYYLNHSTNSASVNLSTSSTNTVWTYSDTYGMYYTYSESSWWGGSTTYYCNLRRRNNSSWSVIDNTEQTTLYPVTLYQPKEATPTETEIVFKGLLPGETDVTIGEKTYHIIVEHKRDEKTVTKNKTIDLGAYTGTFEVANTSVATAKIDENGHLIVTGVTAGMSTTVTTDKVIYTINVTDFDIDDTDVLYVDFWVTNKPVNPTGVTHQTDGSGTSTSRSYTSINPNLAAGEDGVRILDIINSTTGTVYATGNKAVIWKARYLPQGANSDGIVYRQTIAAWSNKSGEGTDTITKNVGFDFEYVRYNANGWQYKDKNGTWKEFPNNPTSGTTTASGESGAQIAIYYRQPTDVTKEVTTEVIDWSDGQTTSTNGVTLDFAVKYEGNDTRYPSTYGKANNKNTMWFTCQGEDNGDAAKNGYTLINGTDNIPEGWIRTDTNGSGRKYYRVLNNIRAVENDSGYELYMITVTPTNHNWYSVANQQCPDNVTYYLSDNKDGDGNTYEKIIWAIDEETADKYDFARMSAPDLRYGGEPDIDRILIQQGTGILVTYYVRPKQVKVNLKVHYIDKSNGYEFYNYGIATKGDTFSADFAYDAGSEDYLTGNTVVNLVNETETVTGDLTKMLGVPARYRRIKFKCDSATINADRTEVFIYYVFDNAKSYAVDFGIPVKITGQDLVNDNEITVTSMCLVDNKEKEHAEFTTRYGKATVVNGEIRYQLTAMDFTKPENSMSVDTFTVRCKGYKTGNESQTDYIDYLIKIYPANSIYYEAETGVKNNDDGTVTGGDFITFAGEWTKIDNNGNKIDTDSDVYQALEALGNALYPFGYDPSYRTWTKFSLGSAMKTTVDKNTSPNPTATFTFTGTGFDVISLTSRTTGAVFVKVTKEDGTVVKNNVVNTYFGYQCDENGVWKPTEGADNPLYQIPVIKVSGLDYGKYKVEISPKYYGFFDILNKFQYDFYLDAIRIYDPAGDQFKGMVINKNDSEKLEDEIFYYTKYYEVRDLLDGNNSVFVDGKEVIDTDSEDYKSVSPNHEVYLAGGDVTNERQKFAFKIKVPSTKKDSIKSVEIAAKLVQGDIVLMTSSVPFVTSDKLKDVTKTDVKIDTATDMYYKFDMTNVWTDDNNGYSSATFVIQNSSTSKNIILSLTNIKITSTNRLDDDTETLMFVADDETVEAALNYTYVPEPETPEEPEVLPFEPEYISASWKTSGRYLRTCSLSVVTSRDVDKLTLDGSELTARTAFRRVNGKYQSVYVWTYVKMNAPKGDYELVAYNEDGVASEPVVVTLDK